MCPILGPPCEVSIFREMSYATSVFKLAADRYGSPQARLRYYIVMLYYPHGADELDLEQRLRGFLKSAERDPPDVFDYILPDTDTRVEMWLNAYKRNAKSSNRRLWEKDRARQLALALRPHQREAH